MVSYFDDNVLHFGEHFVGIRTENILLMLIQLEIHICCSRTWTNYSRAVQFKANKLISELFVSQG